MADPRIVFLGTPRPAATILRALLDGGVNVVHVITGEDKRRGRGSKTEPSPVKILAESRGIPVSHDLSWCESGEADGCFGVVVAYGRLIPRRILDMVPMVNVHFSLLPRWRGATPVERAIMEGDSRTGVCLMQMEAGLDTGPVLESVEVAIDDRITADELTDVLARRGGLLLLSWVRSGSGSSTPQTGHATYAHKITSQDAVIDWGRGAAEIARQVRAVRAHTWLDGRRVRIVDAVPESDSPSSGATPGAVDHEGCVATGSGRLRLLRVQSEGRPVLDAVDWMRGLRTSSPVFDRTSPGT